MNQRPPRATIWRLARASFLFALAAQTQQGCSNEDPALVTHGKPSSGQSNTSKDDDKPSAEAGKPSEDRASEWFGDGSPDSVQFTEVYVAPERFFCTLSCRPGLAVDLDWNPVRPGELWVVFRQAYEGQACENKGDTSGCELLESKVAIISGADTDKPVAVDKIDGNAWHFMRLVTSIAFADDDTFATVGEARTGNFTNEPLDYMGPTWWSSDPNIFAQDFNLNGSHLDMLHATPFGMGIAHDPTLRQTANGQATEPVFWAFNGQSGAIDRYDFNLPHEPGGEDHTDGELARYVNGELKMVSQVPSHLEFANRNLLTSANVSQPDWWLYIVDSGHQRVVRLDPDSGVAAAEPLVNDDAQIANPKLIEGADLVEVVAPGTLTLPSGIAVLDDIFFVSDTKTSTLFAFDLDGKVLGKLDTGFPEGTLAGISIGPDRRLYLVDWNQGRVLRVEPS